MGPAQQIMNKDDERTKGAFIFNNEPYHVPFPVIDYKDEERGFSFESPMDWENYGVREVKDGNGINSIVLHWDVCVSSKQCFRVLCQRGISAHIMIDGDGSVYQILDLIKLAHHAAGGNNNSIGIMVQNPVDLNRNTQNRNYTESREPGNNNKFYTHLDYTNKQKEMVVKVCDALCGIFRNIPKILPPLGDDGLITTAVLPREKRIGIIGHYNVNPTSGPGDSLWIEFYKSNFPIRD